MLKSDNSHVYYFYGIFTKQLKCNEAMRSDVTVVVCDCLLQVIHAA